MTDLYQEAGRIVQRANLKEGSLKTLVYSSSYRNLRQLFALVSESIKYQSILKDLLGRCGSLLQEEEIINNDPEVAVVLLYEQLVGNGFGRAGFVRKVMRKYKAEIKAAHDQVLSENNAVSLADILKGITGEIQALPRYARVNLIKCSVTEATDKLCEDGWDYVGELTVDRFQENVTSLGEAQFGLDPLLNDVLVFPANTDLHDYGLVTDGTLVLQDRASCVPAHALNPVPGSVVLDCCAAPGNKTSHLASLMGDQGRIIALDRDAKRMTTMKSLLERSGASCVEMIVQDFLTLSPNSDEVQDIMMIQVDPSCSGSGMLGSRMSSTDRAVNPNRLESLKRFQISLLKHALRFPNAQRVVYSTCSIHQQENEEVVEEVMSNVSKYFKFVPVFPEWPDSRGLEQFENHKNFLRLTSEKHLSAGFFVACFERKKSSVPSCENNGEDEILGDKGYDNERLSVNDSETVKGKKRKERLEDIADMGEINGSGCKKKKEKDIDTTETAENQSSCSEIIQSSTKKKEKKKSKMVTVDDVVDDVAESSLVESIQSSKKHKKKKKCDKEREVEESDGNDNFLSEDVPNSPERKKKKKKRKDVDANEMIKTVDKDNSFSEKKTKKRKNEIETNDSVVNTIEGEKSFNENLEDSHKKKKRKQKESDGNVNEETKDTAGDSTDEDSKKKKKKAKKKNKSD